jgi:uncharacterized protein YdaU (DUF1376 family)
MALQKPEWFKMDAAKFLCDAQVDAMTTLELGACLRLLCRQWIDGYIPDDQHLLTRLCRLDAAAMEEAWGALSRFFPVVEVGKRANRFMWIERQKIVADLEKRSDEGTKAARKRWDDVRGKRDAAPNGSPIPHPIQDQSRPEQTRADENSYGSPIPHPMPDQSRVDENCSSEAIVEQPSVAPSKRSTDVGFNSIEIARTLCTENGWSGEKMIWAFRDAVEFQAKRMPEASLEQVGEWLVRAYMNRRAAKGDFAGGPQKFFEQALYREYSGESRKLAANVLVDNPATRALAQMEGD